MYVWMLMCTDHSYSGSKHWAHVWAASWVGPIEFSSVPLSRTDQVLLCPPAWDRSRSPLFPLGGTDRGLLCSLWVGPIDVSSVTLGGTDWDLLCFPRKDRSNSPLSHRVVPIEVSSVSLGVTEVSSVSLCGTDQCLLCHSGWDRLRSPLSPCHREIENHEPTCSWLSVFGPWIV